MKIYKLLLLVFILVLFPACADNSDYFQIVGISKYKSKEAGKCTLEKEVFSDHGTIDFNIYQRAYSSQSYNYILFLNLKNNMVSSEPKDDFTNQISVKSANVSVEFGDKIVEKKLVTEFILPGNKTNLMNYELSISELLGEIFRDKPAYDNSDNKLNVDKMIIKVKFNGLTNNDREISSNEFTYRVRTCFDCLRPLGDPMGENVECKFCHAESFQDLAPSCEKKKEDVNP